MVNPNCSNSANAFCYICGKYCVTSQRRDLTENTKKYYSLYFARSVEHQHKDWAPHFCCKSCEVNLNSWWSGTRDQMPFAVPMIWRKPRNHRNDCYFCMTKVVGFSSKNKNKITYPDCSSATKPVLHGDQYPIPITPNQKVKDKVTEKDSKNSKKEAAILKEEKSTLKDPDYIPESSDEPHLLNQSELSDLIRDLNLTKQRAELLASRLKQWNLLKDETKVSFYRDRNKLLSPFFLKENSICYCRDIDGLMLSLGFEHKPNEWRLFIDGSTESLKAVLLHNGNEKPSIPIAHTVEMKESHESMEAILSAIKYQEYQWDVCCDLKVVSILLGLQGGYTKHMCFLCLWDSRADSEHYIKKVWPPRKKFVPGKENVEHVPMIDPRKIILPPLHINPV